MKKFILTFCFALTFSAPAFADTISTWCPDAAVCSQQRDKRIIVYDPSGSFRQTTLSTDYVPASDRSRYAAQYSKGTDMASDQVYDRSQKYYVKQYSFHPVGGY